ncbi:unnamed protein product [Kuraishia capsulata CBS 1993]|uniref:UvrD-like helicase ATP-binding domain-containing protein n=1 Tax=Kuraishia capsulata CBS 1993 TaxID=1382522 RepID=W6MFA3_9ASCO|nr:uncharacterized protein KUCA_T00000121001 [Kuraishia capsulata CBS 1993]CDK24161.1 unnamed protein product [Kuraishia capsulata CBS 1993]
MGEQIEHEGLEQLIRLSHQKPTDNTFQESVLVKCLEYINALPKDAHLFCDPANINIASYALVIFVFDQVPVRDVYAARLEQNLSSCPKCCRMFHVGRAKLREDFLLVRKFDLEGVTQLMSTIFKWESERLVPVLSDWLEKAEASDHESLNSQASKAVLECMDGPAMFRVNPELKSLFTRICERLQDQGDFIDPIQIISPGLIYLLFEGTPKERDWALDVLHRNTAIEKVTTVDFDPAVSEEYEIHFFNIQDSKFFTPQRCIDFWCNMIPILNGCEATTVANKMMLPAVTPEIAKKSPFQIVQLWKVFSNQFMSYLEEPLPFLLRAFQCFLNKLGQKFWNLVAPFTFQNFMDPVFRSPHYIKYLKELTQSTLTHRNQESSTTPCTEDVVGWIDPLCSSLSLAMRPGVATRTLLFAWNQLGINNIGFLLRSCFKIFSEFLYIPDGIYDDSFRGEALLRIETRRTLDQHCKLFIDVGCGTASFGDAALSKALKSLAIACVCRSLEFDVNYLAQRSFALYKGETVSTSGLSPKMWEFLTAPQVLKDQGFVTSIIASLKNACGIFRKDGTQLKAENLLAAQQSYVAIAPHYDAFERHLSTLLFKMSQYMDTITLQSILTDSQSASGFWSCIFSADEKTYQAGVQMLYEAFDVEARLEGVAEALKLNAAITLSSISRHLQVLSSLGIYEACPRAVRILMDVVTSLTDPIRGMLVTLKEFSATEKRHLRAFWKECWGLLNMIYTETLKWATSYQQSFLVEFTRDTLEFSDMLVSGYHLVKAALLFQSDSQQDLSQSLLHDLLATFPRMLVWLRLGDELLLNSCVTLIFKAMDLTLSLDLKFDNDIIILLTKYGLKAPKFKNKLTGEQRDEILERAVMLNADLVLKTKLEIDTEVNGKPKDVPLPSQQSHSSQERAAPNKVQSHITDMFKRASGPPVAPPKPQARLSMLEQAKLDLAARRKSEQQAISNKAPAAPRPAGFNKKSQLTSDDDSEEEEVEEEDDSDNEGHIFINDKTQKLKKAIASLKSGRSLLRSTVFQKKGVSSIEQQKRKEELYMRLRLNVNVDPLYKVLLQWSFTESSAFPPGTTQNDYTTIKSSFDTAAEYKKTFEPLLLLESWQGIQNAKQVSQEKPLKVTIASRAATDTFFDVFASASRDDVIDRRLGDSDLIALMFIPNVNTLPSKNQMKDAVSCLAKVREIKNSKPGYSDMTLRVSTSNSLLTFLTPGTELFCIRVMQMITIEREFSSLAGLQYYNLVDHIVKAEPCPPVKLSSSRKLEMRKIYGVNESQAEAILGAVESEGFSLIQGPPGTGKTKTILGIIGHAITSSALQSRTIAIPGMEQTRAPSASKILVCAPSNAAVDELVLRLRSGIRDSKGALYRPRVVRLGRSDAILDAVKDMTLEYQVESELSHDDASSSSRDTAIRQEHTACLEEREKIRKELKNPQLSAEAVGKLEIQLQSCLKRKNELGRRLDEERQRASVAHRNNIIRKRSIQNKILSEAEVICSTLSGSAHEVLASLSIKFDTVVVDEAAQCIELSAIIPLRYGTTRCIMVGDPNQLPPTVLSQAAAKFKYEQSLFVRMMERFPKSVYMLDVQYRMHPAISSFPSAEFYHSKLLDGPDMATINSRPWHSNPFFQPYMFFEATGRHEQNSLSKSLFNPEEAQTALQIVKKLLETYPNEDWTGKIGIISPYKEQVGYIRKQFFKHFGGTISLMVDFNTVDGFQGQEKDIILISCVRSDESSGVGFLADVRRMNVALTRARSSLWVIGNPPALNRNKVWRALISDARERSCCIVASPGFLKKPHPVFRKSSPKVGNNQSDSKDTARTGVVSSSGETDETPTTKDNEQSNISDVSADKKSDIEETERQKQEFRTDDLPVEEKHKDMPIKPRPPISVHKKASAVPDKTLKSSRGLSPRVSGVLSPQVKQQPSETIVPHHSGNLGAKVSPSVRTKPSTYPTPNRRSGVLSSRNSHPGKQATSSGYLSPQSSSLDGPPKKKRNYNSAEAKNRPTGPTVPGLPADMELIPAAAKYRNNNTFTSPDKRSSYRDPIRGPSDPYMDYSNNNSMESYKGSYRGGSDRGSSRGVSRGSFRGSTRGTRGNSGTDSRGYKGKNWTSNYNRDH